MLPGQVEIVTRALAGELLQMIGEFPRPPEPGYLLPICLDALARAVAGVIAEAPDYHQALDRFRGFFNAALMAEG